MKRDFSLPKGGTDLVTTLAGLEVDLISHCCQQSAVVEVERF